MQKFVTIFHPDLDGGRSVSEVTRVPELVKAHPEGCNRSALFTCDDQKSLAGPLTLVFAIRRARDLLLENCEYHGVDLQLEVSGRTLPQLPAARELEKLLNSPDTLVHVNGNVFKPATEVYGFQQVYDDSVRCIEALRKLGFTQETMAIYATPEEISVEVHGGAIGLEGRENLGDLYYRLLCHVAGIKDAGGRPAKTEVKTILLQSCQKDWPILLPGCNHPTLHRPRVGVGASHFAYGIAAFSDFCGKKRNLQECLQETFSWVKFIQAELPAIAGLKEKIEKLPQLPLPGVGQQSRASAASAPVAAHSGRFQPLKIELAESAQQLKGSVPVFHTIAAGLDKSLGGGWAHGGVHLVIGPRESGKASLLMQQALAVKADVPVLYLSYEHSLRDFALRAAASTAGLNLSDLQGHLAIAGAVGDNARSTLAAAYDKLHELLPSKLFFSGVDTGRHGLDPREIQQLAAMMPGDGEKLVLIDSVCESDFVDGPAACLKQMREIAAAGRLTIIIAVHNQVVCDKRPHFIEDKDIELLDRYQRHTDSIIVMHSEKVNLRRFVAMIKGQIDAQLVGSLEQKALQLAGNKRLKTDTYTLMRLIHTRNGRRDLLLFLYQPDMGRLYELAALAMARA